MEGAAVRAREGGVFDHFDRGGLIPQNHVGGRAWVSFHRLSVGGAKLRHLRVLLRDQQPRATGDDQRGKQKDGKFAGHVEVLFDAFRTFAPSAVSASRKLSFSIPVAVSAARALVLASGSSGAVGFL